MSTIEPAPHPRHPRELGLTLEVDRAEGVIRPRGEIDVATAPLLEREAHDLWDGGAERVVLDLGAVTFFDSSALRLLLRFQALADADDRRRFALAGCSDAVRRVLDLTRLTDRFPRASA